jgi:hypothetical protein
MPKKKKGNGPKKKKEEAGTPDKGNYPSPRQRNPDADPVKIHREYVERRLGGGAPATQEAYARAVEQWHQLPGAVRKPPTELGASELVEESPQKTDESRRGEAGA